MQLKATKRYQLADAPELQVRKLLGVRERNVISIIADSPNQRDP
jgi:hypothetical protein